MNKLEQLRKQFKHMNIPTGLTVNTNYNKQFGGQNSNSMHKEIAVSVCPLKFISENEI